MFPFNTDNRLENKHLYLLSTIFVNTMWWTDDGSYFSIWNHLLLKWFNLCCSLVKVSKLKSIPIVNRNDYKKIQILIRKKEKNQKDNRKSMASYSIQDT